MSPQQLKSPTLGLHTTGLFDSRPWMERDSEGPTFPWGTMGYGWMLGKEKPLWTHKIPKDSSTITTIQVALVKVSGSQNRKIYLQERDLWGRGGMNSRGREMKDGKGGREQPRPHSHKQHCPDINLTSGQKARVETEKESSINRLSLCAHTCTHTQPMNTHSKMFKYLK